MRHWQRVAVFRAGVVEVAERFEFVGGRAAGGYAGGEPGGDEVGVGLPLQCCHGVHEAGVGATVDVQKTCKLIKAETGLHSFQNPNPINLSVAQIF